MGPIHTFPNRKAALDAATIRVELALRRRLAKDDRTALIVSGGSTPGPIYSNLSHRNIDWHRVEVVLSDERWVPPENEDSNERMVRERLLTSRGTYATLTPLYAENSTPERRAREVDGIIGDLPSFACTLLGMGADGHFASLFGDADNLAAGVLLEGGDNCIVVQTAASPYARLSLTLSALTRSDEVILVLFGYEKRKVLEQAKVGIDSWPVSHLIRQQRSPVDVYWAA